MKHHSILILVILSIGSLILGGLYGCNSKGSGAVATDENIGRNTQTINLFPKESFVQGNTGKLSFDEAFVQSKLVIRTAYLKQIDNSNARGGNPFYVYQVNEGWFEKSVDDDRNKFPILFISERELFRGKILRDSVCLFLASLQQYQILQENISIKYEWVHGAPFLRH
jgi:hypothetical protein